MANLKHSLCSYFKTPFVRFFGFILLEKNFFYFSANLNRKKAITICGQYWNKRTLTKMPQFSTYAIFLTLKKTRRSVQEGLDKKKKLQKIKRSMKNVTFVKLMSLGLFPNFFFVHQTLFNCGCHLGKTSKLPFFPGLIPPDIRVGPQKDDPR